MKTKDITEGSSKPKPVKDIKSSNKKTKIREGEKGTNNKKSILLEYIQVIAVAFVLVFGFMRPFVVEAFKIPSASMEDTLLIGDRILVAKFMYGITVPYVKFHRFDIGSEFESDLNRGAISPELKKEFENKSVVLSNNAGVSIKRTGSRWLIGDSDQTYVIMKKGNKISVYKNLHLLEFNKPKIGDIFVFEPPEAAGKTQNFIKRIVGTPGDVIEVKDGNLYRNSVFIEGEDYTKRYPFNPQSPQFMPPVTVPENHVFAMGDNRDRSSDSRVWGFVPVENIKGEAFMIYWSWDKYGDLAHKLRVSRVGKVLR